ncbi:PAS domain-containing protein [Pseudomonas sp. 43A]|jgi:signal transduction histidine kinase|uniref:ATP-binding protein n=1 Tax=Pseudomonas TaxID=286 RepID=UPI00030CEA87|nr:MULTISPECIES: ATP-binding protein [Pseudomonas]QKV64719.1 PAS domain-containing protein [Pseudomonas sp. 43A]QMW12827.1 PAS domain-containing protein [Pseudomonas sp. 29A]
MPFNSNPRLTRLLDASLKPLENLLIGFMAVLVAGGMFLANQVDVDFASTALYLALLLLTANLLTIVGVIYTVLLSMLALTVMFVFQGGFEQRESTAHWLRELAVFAAIALLALRGKQVADHLRHKEVYMSGAQRLSQTGCFGFRADLTRIGWSQQSARIFEYPSDTPPTVDMILARTHPEDVSLVLNALQKASCHDAMIEVRYRLLMPDGRVRHLHMIATPLCTRPDRFEYLGALMDVTAIEHAEAALSQAQMQLAHVSRVTALGELAASIAHEVNQPLAAITSSGEACRNWLSRPQPDLPEARQALERIIASADRGSEITARVRALSQKSAPLRRTESLNDIVNETLPLVRHELADHGISAKIELTVFDGQISADRVQLQQVIINLIINACQAMSTVNAAPRTLLLRTSVSDREALLEVADQGPGICATLLEQLFTPFFTTKEHGLGMGLSICRSILDAHQGRIWASSTVGQGSSFMFALPLLAVNDPGYASAI